MSRKADYDTQAPLCGPRLYRLGCHKIYDDYPWEFRFQFPGFNPEKAAAETQRLWLEHEGGV